MILLIIHYILFSIIFIYGLYFAVLGFLGVIKKNKNIEISSKKKNYFAILIPARNEEKVIGNLIDSLNNLDYPKDKYQVYVIPNNCSDNTKSVAIKHGARIIDCDIKTRTKGDVLKYAFQKLKNKKIDAYLIFDADNVVSKDFLIHANNYLEMGYKVGQGFRDAKNPSDNWISGSYSIFYLIQNVFFNHSRINLNASSSLNGTGLMIKKSLITKRGFETLSLTEDMEFSGQCALENEKIAFMESAITYDEYPNKFKTAWKQRKRWSAGVLECRKLYSLKLFKNFFKTHNLASLDNAMLYLGPTMQVLSLIDFLLIWLYRIITNQFLATISYILTIGWIFYFLGYFADIAINTFVVKYRNKSFKTLYKGIFMFLIFIFTWIPINILCMLKKQTKWEEIKHNRNVKIDEIKKI